MGVAGRRGCRSAQQESRAKGKGKMGFKGLFLGTIR